MMVLYKKTWPDKLLQLIQRYCRSTLKFDGKLQTPLVQYQTFSKILRKEILQDLNKSELPDTSLIHAMM